MEMELDLELDQLNLIIDALRFFKEKGVISELEHIHSRIKEFSPEYSVAILGGPERIDEQWVEDYQKVISRTLNIILTARYRIVDGS